MSDQMTEREAALAARIKELEDASAKSAATTAEGGALESVWRKVADIVPSSLVAAGLAVLVAHYGFGYYLQSQVTAAETQLKQAKAKLETAKANAANSPEVQGVTLRLKTLTSEIDNKRAEAAAAKANATALNAQINGESAALAAAKANLDNLQNQARLAQAKADAASENAGYGTLAQKEAYLKVFVTEMEAAHGRLSANIASGANGIAWAICVGNQFAKELGCSAQYIAENQRNAAIERGEKPAQVATAPSDDNSDDWKPRGKCARQLEEFNHYSNFGSFAITKRAKNGQSGCAWGAGAGKSRERVRRDALELCRPQGADCKIISER